MEKKKIFFPTIVKNTGSTNTLITDQDIIDTRYFYRAETIHATSNFNFHDSVDWNILWYKKFIQS